MRGWNILKADRLSRCIPCHADVVEDLARCVAAPATKATFYWVNFPYFPWRNAKDKEKEGLLPVGTEYAKIRSGNMRKICLGRAELTPEKRHKPVQLTLYHHLMFS